MLKGSVELSTKNHVESLWNHAISHFLTQNLQFLRNIANLVVSTSFQEDKGPKLGPTRPLRCGRNPQKNKYFCMHVLIKVMVLEKELSPLKQIRAPETYLLGNLRSEIQIFGWCSVSLLTFHIHQVGLQILTFWANLPCEQTKLPETWTFQTYENSSNIFKSPFLT